MELLQSSRPAQGATNIDDVCNWLSCELFFCFSIARAQCFDPWMLFTFPLDLLNSIEIFLVWSLPWVDVPHSAPYLVFCLLVWCLLLSADHDANSGCEDCCRPLRSAVMEKVQIGEEFSGDCTSCKRARESKKKLVQNKPPAYACPPRNATFRRFRLH